MGYCDEVSDLQASIVRCSSCAAPLGRVAHAEIVVCRYCKAENHVSITAEAAIARAHRFQVAADEARAMAQGVEARSVALMAEYQALSERVLRGEKALAPRALELLEGYTRLQYAPTLHMYAAWGSGDPRTQSALHEIDTVIAKVVAAGAKSLGVD